MKVLDVIYTHNAYQGIFQLYYDREQYNEGGTFVYVTRVIQNWILQKRFGSTTIPDKPRTYHWSRPSRSIDIIYDFDKFFYSARIVHADDIIPNRTWMIEVEVAKANDKLMMGVKVQFTSDSPEKDYHQANIPGFMHRINEKVKLYDAGTDADHLHIISSKHDIEELYCIIGDEDRILPVIIISEDGSLDPDSARYFEVDEGYHVDGNKLARALKLFAHVYYLPLEFQNDFCEMAEPDWGTFNGAVRTYYPSFSWENSEDMNAYDHPFITARKILPMNYVNEDGDEYIAGHAFRHILTHRIKIDNMTFRMDWKHFGILLYYRASRQIQTNAENDMEELQELNEYYCEQYELKENECKQLEEETKDLKDQIKKAQSINMVNQQRITELENKLKELHANPPMVYPTDYQMIEKWVVNHFAGRIELHKRAIRCLKEKPAFQDIKLICQSIELLGTTGYDMKMGFLDNRKQFEQECNELKIEISPTGSVASSGRQGDSYSIDYQGERRRLDMHIKGGKSMNSHDDRERFRIYYFWDDESNIFVIGHLPGHLHTSQS